MGCDGRWGSRRDAATPSGTSTTASVTLSARSIPPPRTSMFSRSAWKKGSVEEGEAEEEAPLQAVA